MRNILSPRALVNSSSVKGVISKVLAAPDRVRTAEAELVQDHIAGLIHRKSISADLAFYESPDFYDHLHRARDEAGSRPMVLLEKLGTVVQHGVTLIAMLAVLAGFGILGQSAQFDDDEALLAGVRDFVRIELRLSDQPECRADDGEQRRQAQDGEQYRRADKCCS